MKNLVKFISIFTAFFISTAEALTFDYDTKGGTVNKDNDFSCVTSTDGTCDHLLGNIVLHSQDSPQIQDALNYLPGFQSKGLKFAVQDPSIEYPGVCWGTPGNESPDPTLGPFNGVSGETFGGFNGTTEVDGEWKLFGILAHFNRDINLLQYSTPSGFDSEINWYLKLTKNGNPVFEETYKYQLNFVETANRQNPCPRTIAGDYEVHFQDGSNHIHHFLADGAPDPSKNIDGLGCDDATSFYKITGQDYFEYDHKIYKINIAGFFKGDPISGECDLSSYANTLWSEEQEVSVGCVLFNITTLEGCTPGYWKQYVKKHKKCGCKKHHKCKKHKKHKKCKPCKYINSLTIKYTGNENATEVKTFNKKGCLLETIPLNPDGTFVVSTVVKPEMTFVIGNYKQTIHTSCSRPIGPGMSFGDLLIEDWNAVGVKQCKVKKKRKMHSWGNIDPNTKICEAFDVSCACEGTNITLKKAILKKGCGAVYPHLVAAYLNAYASEVLDNFDYYYSLDDLKSMVQTACEDNTLSYEELTDIKEKVEKFNESYCPLDKYGIGSGHDDDDDDDND